MKFLNAEAGSISNYKERWLLILIAIFLATFFLPKAPAINNIALFLLVAFCWWFNSWKEKLQLFYARPAIIIIVVFNLFQLISVLISIDKDHGFRLLQLRLPLLLFPISLGLIYLRPALKYRALLINALITTAAAVYCLITAYILYIEKNDTGFLYNDALTYGINKQSVYFALIVNVAIFSFGYLLIKKLLSNPMKWIAIGSIGFLMIIHFLLASRMEISFLYATVVAFALYHFFIVKKNKTAGFGLIAALAICGIVFVQLFPKTINRFNELMYPKFEFNSEAVESHYNGELTAEQWNGLNIRLAIWTCGMELIKANPLIGVGMGDKEKALTDEYNKKDFRFGIRTNKNMHSNYLDLFASMGLIGFGLFVFGFVILPMRGIEIFGLLILVDFMLSFVTETYLDRSMGCVVFGFWVSLLLALRRPQALSST